MANRFQAALYREMLYLIEQGVLSVEDTDAAVCYGPGLRWGVMGQSRVLGFVGSLRIADPCVVLANHSCVASQCGQ